MRPIFTLIFLSLILLSNVAYAVDNIAIEVKVRESAADLYKDVTSTITLPITFSDEAEFNAVAQSQGFTPQELKQQLQLTLRLLLATGVKVENNFPQAQQLIEQLSIISHSEYDLAFLYAMQGRFAGRSRQDFPTAITEYNRALDKVQSLSGVQALLLKHTIHQHLGDLNRIVRQNEQGLYHLGQYRQLAYQLKNGYLIAKAEAAMGHYYNKTEQLTRSLQHYAEAIRLSEQLNKPYLKAQLQLSLARVYRDLRSWDEALTYAHRSAEEFTRLEHDSYVSASMTVIAMVYGEQGMWNQAIDYYLNAHQLDVKRKNYTAQALNYHNLGEAYYNNGQTQLALDVLKESNGIFVQRKSNHYLVYSDLLIAEVANSAAQWQLVDTHATRAYELATSQTLLDEQIEALQYHANALKNTGQLDETLQVIEQLIVHANARSQQTSSEESGQTSSLTEQKLKPELNQLSSKQKDSQAALEQSKIALVVICIILAFSLLTLFNVRQGRKKLQLREQQLSQQVLQDPLSQLPGYRALIAHLSDTDKPKTIASFSLTAQLNSDINQGLACNSDMIAEQFNAIVERTGAQVFVIRPGLFSLCLHEQVEPQHLLEQIRLAINEHHGDTAIHLGLLQLPLLDNPNAKLSAQTYYTSLQMVLAGAQSLGESQDYYVTFKPLNFTPVAIFTSPLYLHLEKAIARGLLKVTTNGNKDTILWPRWKSHQDIDVDSLN
ncbi:tetratricopeptide repeat protein [Shewanella waksmanii]|uniref:tetratricopeptide repeat protein n=1 Tax=Shewanella waksmanii TaxID=213783 RepID=UPI000491DD76|nr:tetratricopeptide repeat protein [Shewanella waksmanii]